MKLDVGLGVEGKYLQRMSATAASAEEMGFAGLWTSETKHDSFLPLAIAANETEEVELGTSVAIAFSRSPMEVAQTAWDLQDLSGGRFILGLGTQVKAHVERRFSMQWGKPASRLREYILALRAIWESFQNEDSLKFEGEFYQHTLMTPFFNPGPIDHPEIPVYIAGVNTRPRGACRGAVRRLPRPPVPQPGVRPAGHTARHRRRGRKRRPQGRRGGACHKCFHNNRGRGARADPAADLLLTPPPLRTAPSSKSTAGKTSVTNSGSLARDKKWREMPGLVTDEMLSAFAVEAAPDEVGSALKERYEGLIDRVRPLRPVRARRRRMNSGRR